MKNTFPIGWLAISWIVWGCGGNYSNTTQYASLAPPITICGPSSESTFVVPDHPRWLGDRSKINLPLIQPNDNRKPAGKLKKGVLHLELEVRWGDFRTETLEHPGVLVAALAEKNRPLTIPGPLIRVETGTRIKVRLHNPLSDSTLTFFGLQERPIKKVDSVFLQPGETSTVEFMAGEPGTYLYRAKLGKGIPNWMRGEEEQLAGAFVIDPKGGHKPDRIFVMNIFSTSIDTKYHEWGAMNALTINGKSWPQTELLTPNVGDTLRWKVVNASQRLHPMHLHGFYYHVTGTGRHGVFKNYSKDEYRYVVTESMFGRSTMDMEWVPARPGKWLFHCHLSWHVAPQNRLPGADFFDPPDSEPGHMSGLAIGLDVKPGPTDLTYIGDKKEITVYAIESDTTPGFRYRFSLDGKIASRPGPALILKQYQPTYVTVVNRLSVPTSIHWHGLEVESWADGVPGWSASSGKKSPEIKPGESFTYQLAAMRAGTFIYHSHLEDAVQLTEGLYGPLLVLADDETFDPTYDHLYSVGMRVPEPVMDEQVDCNGFNKQPDVTTSVGTTHRLRLMHIGAHGLLKIRMRKEDRIIPLKYLAKDGADLPPHQRVMVDESPRYGVGETADFEFAPTEAGAYTLTFNWLGLSWSQGWIVNE